MLVCRAVRHEAVEQYLGGCLAYLYVLARSEGSKRRRFDGILSAVQRDRRRGFVNFGQSDNAPEPMGYAFDCDEGEDAWL